MVTRIERAVPQITRNVRARLGIANDGSQPENADADPRPEPPPHQEYQPGADADRDGQPSDKGPRFVPVAIDNVTISAEPPWLIDGLLPARGLACIVGPPKSGKSFLTSDMLFSVARCAPYAGRQTIPGPVVYLTGEGVNGFKRRLVAMRRHHDTEGAGTPFYMVDNVPDLGSEQTDLPRLVADLDAFIAEQAPEGVRAIVLDTLARCMGEADENAARDMGRFVNRCSAIERHFECVVVVVHHVGKDPSRGSRGSNSLNGAADVTMIVEKNETLSKVRVDEMKDGREGQEWTFRLVPYDLSATFGAGCAPPPQPRKIQPVWWKFCRSRAKRNLAQPRRPRHQPALPATSSRSFDAP